MKGNKMNQIIFNKYFFLLTLFSFILNASTPPVDSIKINKWKSQISIGVNNNSKLTQEIVDMMFSFSELGFQEVEGSKYLTGILEKNGFKIEHGVSGIPTAWMARWGSGKPVIALGSDIDCIPKASQKPGVAYKDLIVVDAPGHGGQRVAKRLDAPRRFGHFVRQRQSVGKTQNSSTQARLL